MISKLVTVVIPVFNQQKYIARCIRSILNQTLDKSHYDIIVVDDASTDKTKEILELYNDDITLINNNKNLGLPSSLNIAIKKIKTSYFVRVDSDDYVNENFLKFLYIFLEENKNFDAVACDYLLVDENENVIKRKNSLRSPIACGILFRLKNIIEIGLYDENFLINEDVDLRKRFLKKFNIKRLELPLYRYRRHLNNMTNDKKKMKIFNKKINDKYK